ncbi:MAG: DNA polymerase III subunit beta [Caldilinea sp.]
MTTMVATANNADLAAAIKRLLPLAKTTSTMPILESFKIVSNGSVLAITASDLTSWLTVTVQSEKCEAFECAVSAALFSKAIAAFDDDAACQLQYDEQSHKLTLKSKRSRFSFVTLPARDFPTEQVDEQDIVMSGTWEAKKFAVALDRVYHAMAKRDVRFYLNGALFHARDKVSFVATDGHRMAIERTTLANDVGGEVQLIVDRDAVHSLRALANGCVGDLRVSSDGRKFVAEGIDFAFSTKLIDGQFPNYERAISKKQEAFNVQRKDFLSALRSVACATNKLRGMRIDAAQDKVVVSAKNAEDATAEVSVPAEVLENTSATFNVDYLIDCFESVDQENVLVLYGSSQLEVTSDSSTRVVMQLRD